MASRPPLVVYPSTTKLAVLFSGQVIAIVLLIAACIWLVSSPSSTAQMIGVGTSDLIVIVCTIVGVAAFVVAAAGTGYRLFVAKPAVTVTNEGLIDDCSFLICGVGLIRWQDMQAAYVTRYSNAPSPARIKFVHLVISLRNESAFFAHRSAMIQRLHRLYSLTAFTHSILIPQYILRCTGEEILGTMQTHYEAQRDKKHRLQLLPEPSFAQVSYDRKWAQL